MTNFVIHALPSGEANVASPLRRRMTADGPSPCRRCLRNAVAGDPLLLIPYDPFIIESPYAGEGPIFVHADGCQPHRPAPGEVCEQVCGRLLSVRAYDEAGMMRSSEVLPGERLADRAEALLQPSGSFLHVHFAGPGCFAFRVDSVKQRGVRTS